MTENNHDQTPENEDTTSESQTSEETKKSSSSSKGKTLGQKAVGAAAGNSETGRKVQETAEKVNRARRMANTALSAIKGIAPILLNPYFWAVVAAILLILVLIATTIATVNVLGRNENVDGCIPAGEGGSGVAVTEAENPEDNANVIATWLTTTDFAILGNQPMSIEQAAAIVGNWGHEAYLDPATVQIGGSISTDISNSALANVTASGNAVGLAQWLGGRRTALANFASDNNGHWSDLQIQLEFFKQEIDSGNESTQLVNSGFAESGKDVEHYVTAFEAGFERANGAGLQDRQDHAKSFLEGYNGGYTAETGGSCVTAIADAGQYSGEIAELAASLSYPKGSGNIVPPTPEYREAKKQAEAETGADPSNLYASCDRFVATVLRLTVDPNVPWGATAQQHQYFESSPNWEKYNNAEERQPGDVWITGGSGGSGHVIIHVDDNTIAHASLGQRSGLLTPLEGYFTGMRDNSRPNPYDGYRFVG